MMRELDQISMTQLFTQSFCIAYFGVAKGLATPLDGRERVNMWDVLVFCFQAEIPAAS